MQKTKMIDEARDRRLEHDPLAQKLLARDQGAEIGAERPGGRREHGQNGRRADQRADQSDPVAGLAPHHVDHAARGRVEDPAEDGNRDEEGEPRDIGAREAGARPRLRAFLPAPKERDETVLQRGSRSARVSRRQLGLLCGARRRRRAWLSAAGGGKFSHKCALSQTRGVRAGVLAPGRYGLARFAPVFGRFWQAGSMEQPEAWRAVVKGDVLSKD